MAIPANTISIHAPTRGATYSVDFCASISLFQSTLPREERLSLCPGKRHPPDFNPRSHERSDSHAQCPHIQKSVQFQSTLPREERLVSNVSSRVVPDFNPRSHERSDYSRIAATASSAISIHAPTRGATAMVFSSPTFTRFQSTLPREERRACCKWQSRQIRFQSTLPREERRTLWISVHQYHYFNPRSHERSD